MLILSAAYRAGKKKAEDELRDQMTNGAYPVHPLQGRLMLVARMFEPNRSSRRDIANYAKMVHDALTGIVYEDDSQLDRVTWIRAGVDIDRPRLELTITVLPTVPTHSPEK
ncbi:MAG TPA: RusA family crossover junction endodeoxyribonuclease [Gemmatimonadaceae bacterium]